MATAKVVTEESGLEETLAGAVALIVTDKALTDLSPGSADNEVGTFVGAGGHTPSVTYADDMNARRCTFIKSGSKIENIIVYFVGAPPANGTKIDSATRELEDALDDGQSVQDSKVYHKYELTWS